MKALRSLLSKGLFVLLVPVSVWAQVPDSENIPDTEPPPGNLPEQDGAPGDTRQEGDLNTIKQDVTEDSFNNTYNGAGAASRIPANTAISPSLMSSGSESCLQSVSGGLQLIGVGVSTGKYIQDTECNRRRDSITLSNMGMKVAAVALMCQNENVWRAMFMSATPCPIIRSGRLVVGKTALLTIKQNPELHIPDYKDQREFYDKILGVGDDATNEEADSRSISDRYRTSTGDGT